MTVKNLIPVQELTNVLNPIEHAHGLTNEFYTEQKFFELERDELMGKGWTCIGFASDLAQKSYVKPVDFMGLPLLMMRNREGELKVFHNVCSHRGVKLVQEAGPIQGVIRCPYHSWTYDLNGALRGTPHVGGIDVHKDDRFNCEKHGLKPLRTAIYMDMVLVNLSGDAAPLEEKLAPLTQRWTQFLGADGISLMRKEVDGGSMALEVECNWKLAVENFCEAYHLPWVHPSLNTYSRLEDHYNILFDRQFAGQGSYAYNLSAVAGTTLPVFPAWPTDRVKTAEYVAFFPNTLIGIQADHVFAMMLQPVSPSRTIEHLRVYYIGDEALNDQYKASRDAIMESWKVVFGEDIASVEGMQKGRSSPGYKGGVFSPEMDLPTHFFHRWAAETLLEKAQA
ncbi:aromatic ring-hydroxylating dioxygenase subunit alpha [Pseudomonas syringae]|uniref:aromatic ring-hydroxylating oxygenase subunit alpha n=1 Tax=Pseudomonas sp. Leaf127 TaxID=1736267 RepID=UPI0007029C36|nr:aromatic ring-hydroxylating dioxygenase subunit alpha [Pseudomonas sp. Leaf127]KQQ53775.1 2Fe-2S ferredoxin [Pseudomonas sp. Leaf127]MBD8492258.1 aromatic ring-hydroxylating dioxygenase subunit alpha [Pseudomonas syringae]MBD8576996.1 aromatic ring-hydroxylating dioxygenase subunit alpha [Pseudomonas syringae]